MLNKVLSVQEINGLKTPQQQQEFISRPDNYRDSGVHKLPRVL